MWTNKLDFIFVWGFQRILILPHCLSYCRVATKKVAYLENNLYEIFATNETNSDVAAILDLIIKEKAAIGSWENKYNK